MGTAGESSRSMKKFFLFVFVCVWIASGCGNSKPLIKIAFNTGTSINVVAGQATNITATLTNDSKSAGVTWSLSPATGAGTLSGQTSTSVTYTAPSPIASNGTATITATSISDTTKSAAITINLQAVSISLSPGTTQTDEQGQTTNVTATVSNDPMNKGVTWSLNAGAKGTLGAQTATTATYNAPASITVLSTDTITATSVFDNTKTATLNINLILPPSITTTSLQNATEGTAYSQTVAATGGLTPYTFTISGGALPANLNMDTSGHITGTPTGPNITSNFIVKVIDSGNPKQSATQNLSITVNLPPPPTISTPSLPAGTEGSAYNQTVTATGGLTPYTFAVTGSLPAGLSMDHSGHITGTPTGPNVTTSFTVNVTDSSNPPQNGSKGLSITINLPPAPTITPTTLPNGNVGSPYSQTLTVNGGLGPFAWTTSSGTLPAGLILTANTPTTTAKISGTPTTAQTNVAFTIQVTDTSNPPQIGQQPYTVTINPPAPLSIATTSPLPSGAFNTGYNATIHATGGIAPYTFSLDASSSPLPAGLSFTNDAVNNQGVISGTPTAAGTFTNIIVDVHDSQTPTAATANATFTLTITAPAIVISPATGTLPSATVSTSYTTNITATGGVPPYTFSLDATSAALPAGLSFTSNTTTGTISGTPTAAGTTNGIIVDVKDSESPAVTMKATYSITVNAASTCGSGSESLLNGGYAFVLKGFDSSGYPALVGGILAFNGSGTIASGTLDMNLLSGFDSANLGNPMSVSSGSYSVGSDQRGCMTVSTVAGTQHYRLSVGNITSGVASVAHVIQFDTTGQPSSLFTAGRMYLQSGGPFSNSSLDGSYAFGGSSIQTSTPPTKFGAVGVVAFNGSGTISSGQEDVNEDGTLDGSASNTTWPASALAFTGGSYSVSSNGRATLTLTGAGQTFHVVLYLVSTSQALLLTSDSRNTNSLLAGEAFKQSGSFSANPLSGTYVGYDSGLGSGAAGTDRTDIFLLGPLTTGSSTFTGTQLRNDAGTFTSGALSGTYSVDSAGRMLITGAKHEPVLYLVSATQAFILAGNASVDTGFIQSQTGSPFSSSTPSGTYAYGVIDPEAAGGSVNSGVVVFANPNVTITEDENSSGTLTIGGTQSFTYSVDSTGLGHIPANCTLGTNCQTLFYIISPTKAVVMDVTSSDPKITIADK